MCAGARARDWRVRLLRCPHSSAPHGTRTSHHNECGSTPATCQDPTSRTLSSSSSSSSSSASAHTLPSDRFSSEKKAYGTPPAPLKRRRPALEAARPTLR